MMKYNIKKSGAARWFIGVSIIYAIAIYLLYAREGNRLQEESSALFYQAVNADRDIRLQETGMPVHYRYASNKNDTSSYITIEDEHQIRRIKKTDSLRQLSHLEKHDRMLQTALMQLNPINVYALDSLFRLEWQKKDVSARTAVRYTNHTTGETLYSYPDTLFHTFAFATEKIHTGIGNEITLQAYTGIKPYDIVRRSVGTLGGTILAWFMFVVLWIYVTFRRKKVLAVPSIPDNYLPPVQPERTRYQITAHICLDVDKQILTGHGKEISLTPHLVQLLEFLCQCPDHYASYNDLISALYGEIGGGRNRLSQTVIRLRKELEYIPGLTVKNIPGNGYQLQFAENTQTRISG
jgi:DNA-binding winged helix-turn-helix (wHTH) protein